MTYIIIVITFINVANNLKNPRIKNTSRFWLDLGRRLARLPARPSARPACTRAPRKLRTVPPPPFAGDRSRSAHVVCPRSLLAARVMSAARPSTVHVSHAPCPARQSYYYM